ncbi:MAG: rRNA maturation RNase YbeY [Tepidisphaerales bacterium]
MKNGKEQATKHGRDARATVMRMAITADTGREFVAFLRKMLPKARKLVGGPLGELSVAIVGNRRMAELHERFMGIAGPTDVLTFELEHDRRGGVTSGEVVVCLPVARKRAKELGHEPRLELLLYAIHGMLHLCGFDDKTAADFRKMHAMEDRILTALGIGPVFAADGRHVDRQEADREDRQECLSHRRKKKGGRKCS